MTLEKHKITILVVDDQQSMRQALKRSLEADGYSVIEAASKVDVLKRLEHGPEVSLITLDLKLGQENGLLLAREIRTTRNIPIIMITALDDPHDRLAGLEHGADDYIVKPFHNREVLLRVQSVLRRYELERNSVPASGPSGEEVYRVDGGTVDVIRREMHTLTGELVALTDSEFDILVVFLRNPGRILSRDDLTLKLKGRLWSPTDRTLDGHVARLRKKIEPDMANPTLIKTVWGVGYVFAGRAERFDARPTTS